MWKSGAVPHLCEFYPGICLTTEEKAWKNLSQGKKNHSHVKKNLSEYSIHITKTPTHYKYHRLSLSLSLKPPHYKLKQTLQDIPK